MKQAIRKLDSRRKGAAARPLRHVVAGLMLRPGGTGELDQVLICQRRPDQPMSLKWEFPGGKIELGETAEGALARELSEELGIDAVIGRHLTTVRHAYRNGSAIEIQFFVVDSFAGELQNRIFHDMRWESLAKLPEYDFLAADVELIKDLADGKIL